MNGVLMGRVSSQCVNILLNVTFFNATDVWMLVENYLYLLQAGKLYQLIDSVAFFLVWKNVMLSLVVVQFKVSETPYSLSTGTLTSLPESVAKAKNQPVQFGKHHILKSFC